ncbi:hypothetical protein PG996_011586 [Apiospora saccharicola]|uniref:Uncharacterized protein n=1 Tax=Apiospora saccharicola TaxID=335842 RepID=A0ABR1UIF7_9PEZI
MKFSAAFFGLLSAVPYLAQGFVLPGADNGGVVAARDVFGLAFHESGLLSKREDDDEWLMVVYNGGTEGQQCGGSPNNFHQKGSICQGIEGPAGGVCADLKVNKVTVERGKDNNGVELSDEVKFVEVNCS